jgi:hypothetical protein
MKTTLALDLTGLPEMPDLDTLDEASEFDARPLSEHFGRRFAVSQRQKAAKVVTFDARKVQVAVETIERLPENGEYVHMVVGGEFAGFDLLPAALKLAGAARFDELWLTTLGFSRDNLAQLEAMIKAGQVPPKRLTILCGDFFRRADTGLWDIGRLMAKEHGFGFRSFRSHTKLILAELGGCFFVVESSANLRSCHNVENFTMTQSRELFDFHTGWIKKIWKGAKT